MNFILSIRWILQSDNVSKHKSKYYYLCLYIKKRSDYSSYLNLIENIWENISHYL